MGGGYDTMPDRLGKIVAGDYQNIKEQDRKSQNIKGKKKKKKTDISSCYVKVYA